MRKRQKKKIRFPRLKGALFRIVFIAIFASFLTGGLSLLLIQGANHDTSQMREQILTKAKNTNFTPETLVVYQNDKEVKRIEMAYSDAFLPIVRYDGHTYEETDQGFIIKDGVEVVRHMPYLESSFTALSLLEKDVSDTQEKNYDIWKKLDDDKVEVKSITYGPTKAPSYYFKSNKVNQESAFFTERMLSRVGLELPEGITIEEWEFILNKRLGKVKAIKLSNKDKSYSLLLMYEQGDHEWQENQN